MYGYIFECAVSLPVIEGKKTKRTCGIMCRNTSCTYVKPSRVFSTVPGAIYEEPVEVGEVAEGVVGGEGPMAEWRKC